MSITEHDMAALREMFLDAAGSLIVAHQVHMDDRFREVQSGFVGVSQRLEKIERRMGAVEAWMERVEERIESLIQSVDRVEGRTGDLEKRVGLVEVQVSQLVRLDALERRMAEFEARISG